MTSSSSEPVGAEAQHARAQAADRARAPARSATAPRSFDAQLGVDRARASSPSARIAAVTHCRRLPACVAAGSREGVT